MRLSEAIRLGAMMRPQTFCGLFQQNASCAIGAAMEAQGCPYNEEWSTEVQDAIQMIVEQARPIPRLCPVCSHNCRVGYLTIEHLNDRHRWTRERIADWVQNIELSLEQPVADSTEVAHVQQD